MDNELIELLDKQDWDEILVKLMAFAVWLCNVKHRNLPTSIEPEDLVMDTIDKVYNGERKWNPESDPDLLKYFKSVIKSHLNNELRSGHHAHTTDEIQEGSEFLLENNIEEEIYFRQMDEMIMVAMRGDPEVCIVYKGLKDGLKPREIAEEYGVSIDLVRNAQRRLRLIVLKVIPSRKKIKTN